MRASFLAVAATSVVVLVSTLAQTRPPVHADTLARYEAITTYCEKVDPASTTQYAAVLSNLTQGHTSQEIAAGRNSRQYRSALAEANGTLSRASTDTGIKGCTEFLTEE